MGHEDVVGKHQPEQLDAELRRYNLLNSLTRCRVVAEAVGDTEISADMVDTARSQFFQKQGIKNDEDLHQYLVSQGLKQEDLDWQIALPLRIRAHCEGHYRHKAEAHFLERKNQLDQVVYSLLRVKDRFLAQELYFRIESKEANFADLAALYAEGHEKKTNGIIGPVPLTTAHPALAERMRTSTPGTLMPPFQVAEWWLVMRLESYAPATFDDATAQRMAEELFNQWVREETSRRMAGLQTLKP